MEETLSQDRRGRHHAFLRENKGLLAREPPLAYND